MKNSSCIIVLTLLLKLSTCITGEFRFTIASNVNINSTLHQSKLIRSFKIPHKYLCLKECYINKCCLSCSFETSTSNCNLYKFKSTLNDFIGNNNAAVYTRLSPPSDDKLSLLPYFKNPVLKSSITKWNDVNYNFAISTEMVIDNGNIYYYTVDTLGNNVIKHDSNWMFLFNVSFTIPRVIIQGKSFLYLSSQNNFCKLDYNLTIINSTFATNAYYNGIYYNLTDDTLIVCVWFKRKIDILNSNLNLLSTILTDTYNPLGVSSFNGLSYVTAKNDNSTVIFVINNRKIINTIVISPSIRFYMYAILIDDYGYMALTFEYEKLVKLYNINGTDTGFNISLSNKAYGLKFDYNKTL